MERTLLRTEEVVCPVSRESEAFAEMLRWLRPLGAEKARIGLEAVPEDALGVVLGRSRPGRPLPVLPPTRLVLTGLKADEEAVKMELCPLSAQDAARLRAFRARLAAGLGRMAGLHDAWRFSVVLAKRCAPLGREGEAWLARLVALSRHLSAEHPTSFLLEAPRAVDALPRAGRAETVKAGSGTYLTVT